MDKFKAGYVKFMSDMSTNEHYNTSVFNENYINNSNGDSERQPSSANAKCNMFSGRTAGNLRFFDNVPYHEASCTVLSHDPFLLS